MATLATIRQAVRDMLNEEYQGFYTNAKLNRIINKNYKKLAERLARRTNFYLKKATITTTAGTYLYSISGSTMIPVKQMIKVLDSTGSFLYEFNHQYVYPSDTASSASHYDVLGNQIALYPKPLTTGVTYTVWYHEIPTDLSSDSSTLSIPGGDAAETYLIDLVALDCQYMSGDMDMYSLTRQRLRDDGNSLWALFDTTSDIEAYIADGRLEAPITT